MTFVLFLVYFLALNKLTAGEQSRLMFYHACQNSADGVGLDTPLPSLPKTREQQVFTSAKPVLMEPNDKYSFVLVEPPYQIEDNFSCTIVFAAGDSDVIMSETQKGQPYLLFSLSDWNFSSCETQIRLFKNTERVLWYNCQQTDKNKYISYETYDSEDIISIEYNVTIESQPITAESQSAEITVYRPELYTTAKGAHEGRMQIATYVLTGIILLFVLLSTFTKHRRRSARRADNSNNAVIAGAMIAGSTRGGTTGIQHHPPSGYNVPPPPPGTFGSTPPPGTFGSAPLPGAFGSPLPAPYGSSPPFSYGTQQPPASATTGLQSPLTGFSQPPPPPPYSEVDPATSRT